MNSNIMVKIANNPLLYINESNGRIVVNYGSYYKGKSKIVYLDEFSNMIDALSFRDGFILEFFGVDCSGEYETVEGKLGVIRVGQYLVDSNGGVYSSNGLLLKQRTNRTYSESMFNILAKNENEREIRILLSRKEILEMIGGNTLKMCNVLNRYIRCSEADGFYYVKKESVSDFIESPAYRPPLNHTKSPLVHKPTLPGVTRHGRKTFFIAKVQFKDGSGRKYIMQPSGGFDSEMDAHHWFLDAHYLAKGFFHKTDKRRIKC